MDTTPKPSLLSLLQRPQPTYVEARSIVELQESICITLPPLTKSRPAYAEAKLIAPELSTAPSIPHRLGVLGEFPVLRAYDAKVDGTKRSVINSIITSLHYQITKDLGLTVRVVSDSQSLLTYPPTAILTYLDHIRNYSLMRAMILYTQPTERISELSVQPATHPDASPLVYILPLSPFIATLEASKSTQLAYYFQDDLWRWLAGHSAGHLRPDVTVIVQENHNDPKDREVLRVHVLVITVLDREISLTPT